MQNYGGQIDSIDQYDEMLDRWGEMLEAGDSAGALEMLDQRLPELPEGDDLEDYLSKVLLLYSRLGTLEPVTEVCHADPLSLCQPAKSRGHVGVALS